ncbi:hypothetical protein E4U43_000765 [Claviceps pusilla]|uniref:Increased rDNA silencing protein IRS4 n=1 Tax=Claviceps pusilla TaxID=123648 RepID=A0A9P7NA57_9HYPO|nr:hypothetical protein E4U43_000765 [Claviceps pusilla]
MNHAASSRSIAAPDDAAVALRGASLAFRRNPAAGSTTAGLAVTTTTSPPLQEASWSSSWSSSSHRSSAQGSLAVADDDDDDDDDDSTNRVRKSRHGTGAADSSHVHALKNGSASASHPTQLNGSLFLQQQQQQQQPLASVSLQRLDSKKPSFIAATLAASRGVSPGPSAPQQQQTSRRAMGSAPAVETAASSTTDDAVDSESIPATEKLISLFERSAEAGPLRRRTPSLDARNEHSRAEPRRHKRASSVTSLKQRPAPKPRLKPEPKPRSVAPTLPSPLPLPDTLAVAIPAPKADTETDAKKTHVVPSSTRPPPRMRSAERSAEKISAMPMPKPKPPPHLSLPFPQATGHNSLAHQRQAQPPPLLPPPPALLSARAKPEPSRKSPSPSRSEKSAVDRPHRAQSPRAPSVASASATTEVLSPKPVKLVPPALAPPVPSSPSLSGQKHGSDRRNQGTASSPSRDAENHDTSPHTRAASSPTNPSVGHQHHHHHHQQQQQQRIVAGTGHKPADRNRHHDDSDAPSLSRTEFGLPVVPFAPAPPPLPRGRRDSVASAPTSPVLVPHYSRRRPTITSGSSSNNNNNNNNNLTLDPLTNAIMASSLASAKLHPHNTGSSLPPPTLPQRQRSPRLLQTLRQPPGQKDDDPERVKIAHRHKSSRNKHAHHEGARRRWRDQVTQRERKRYEAVWASNRGYSLFPPDSSHHGRASPPDGGSRPSGRGKSSLDEADCVFNVVVREIWKRSRLPQDELMEVWELVDRGHKGMLTRQEFVVGMWLIDQRLRGRKIPARVSDSVWDSVNGVRLPPPRKK